MSRFNHLLIGLISIVVLVGVGGLLTSLTDQANATYERDKTDATITDRCGNPPTWGGVIPGHQRFIPTFVDSAGVAHAYCDRQTGLVWDAEPSSDAFVWGPEQDPDPTKNAIGYCINRTAPWLGQKGGRLPSVPELASLVDTTSSTCGAPDFLCLPDGHPFQNVQSLFYWSASEVAGIPTNAWFVNFGDGRVVVVNKGANGPAWCVRGAMNADAY